MAEISRGMKRVQKYLRHETLYAPSVVAVAINKSRTAVNDAEVRGDLMCVECPRHGTTDKFYTAEHVACYLGKTVGEVRSYLNMARLVVLTQDRSESGRVGGVANHQRHADDYYHDHYCS